jgi:hypothetical protein
LFSIIYLLIALLAWWIFARAFIHDDLISLAEKGYYLSGGMFAPKKKKLTWTHVLEILLWSFIGGLFWLPVLVFLGGAWVVDVIYQFIKKRPGISPEGVVRKIFGNPKVKK